jgi:ERO1-like protein alpha
MAPPNPDETDEEYIFVNLLANPERYTGYQGEHAHRIWDAIYSQSCFTELLQLPPGNGTESASNGNGSDVCVEARVFYRLVSGMHASISAHIAAHYLLDEAGNTWGPSPAQFKARLGTPDVRYRVQNLYFAYLFVLRAVVKAGGLLAQYAYDTGRPAEDAVTAQLVSELVGSRELADACPMPFDEGRLWRGEGGPALRERMQVSGWV